MVEDSEGIMPSRRGVQGVAMGVANRLLVITQEEVAGPEIRLAPKPGRKIRVSHQCTLHT